MLQMFLKDLSWSTLSTLSFLYVSVWFRIVVKDHAIVVPVKGLNTTEHIQVSFRKSDSHVIILQLKYELQHQSSYEISSVTCVEWD